jgi:hypothetical protein
MTLRPAAFPIFRGPHFTEFQGAFPSFRMFTPDGNAERPGKRRPDQTQEDGPWFVYGLQKNDKTVYLACVGWVLLDLAIVIGVVVHR